MGDVSECKVDHVIERRGLDDAETRYATVDAHLLARWRGDDGFAAMGYRSLTEWFNRRLLKVAYDRHGRDAVGARVDGDYAVLTGDDDLARAELLDDLAADGVDGDGLSQDMVSWSTMRTHLTCCLDGEKPVQEAETEWERESVRIARSHAESKVREALGSLGTKGDLRGADDATVDVQVRVTCGECPTRVPLAVALDRGYVCEQHHRAETTEP